MTSFWPLWVQNDVIWISDFKPNLNNVILVRFKTNYPNDVVLDPKRSKRRRLATAKKKNYLGLRFCSRQEEEEEEEEEEERKKKG